MSRNDERNAEMVAMYLSDAGPTMQEIANKFGLTRQAVQLILKSNGVSGNVMTRHDSYFLKKEQEVLSLKDEILNIAEISEIVGISQQFVRRVFNDNGIKRDRGTIPKLRTKEKYAAYAAYATEHPRTPWSQIADDLGISLMTLHRAIKEHGLQRGVRYDDPEAIKLMKKLRSDGKSLAQVADELNSRGMLPARGDKWSYATVSRILNR